MIIRSAYTILLTLSLAHLSFIFPALAEKNPVPAPQNNDEKVAIVKARTNSVSPKTGKTKFARSLCQTIAAAAKKRQLPPQFLARLIWQESRFNPYAVSPKGARGIAQFMPETARRRGLADAFDPQQAIPASAHYLSDLRRQLGNLGLAAAGYNAGPNRVLRWLAKSTNGRSSLPYETVSFVRTITERSVQDWAATSARFEIPPIIKGNSFEKGCMRLATRKVHLRTKHSSIRRRRPLRPWGVNIAQGSTTTQAMQKYRKVKSRHAGLIGRRKPRIVRLKLGGRGNRTMKIVQIPAGSRNKALSLCRKLLRRGVTCLARNY